MVKFCAGYVTLCIGYEKFCAYAADMDRYWVLKFAFSLRHYVFVPPDVGPRNDGSNKAPTTTRTARSSVSFATPA